VRINTPAYSSHSKVTKKFWAKVWILKKWGDKISSRSVCEWFPQGAQLEQASIVVADIRDKHSSLFCGRISEKKMFYIMVTLPFEFVIVSGPLKPLCGSVATWKKYLYVHFYCGYCPNSSSVNEKYTNLKHYIISSVYKKDHGTSSKLHTLWL